MEQLIPGNSESEISEDITPDKPPQKARLSINAQINPTHSLLYVALYNRRCWDDGKNSADEWLDTKEEYMGGSRWKQRLME